MDIRRVRSETPNSARQRLYQRAILIAIGGNALLAASKGIVAWVSGSSAVFSDAANSISDTLYSLIMGIGLYLSQRPADESHPQGHSRFEPLVSLLIGVAMAAAGVTAISESVQRFQEQSKAIDLGWPTTVLIGSALIKLGMYFIVRKIGEKSRSPAIQASAYDNLADILTTTAALIGVWGSRFLHPLLDPAAGLFVGLWIFRTTWKIMRQNLGYLTGRSAPYELANKIAEIAIEVSGVRDVHRIIADYVGPQLRVDMHINVDPEIELKDAHDIAEKVREKVEALPEVDWVFVHVEPTRTN